MGRPLIIAASIHELSVLTHPYSSCSNVQHAVLRQDRERCDNFFQCCRDANPLGRHRAQESSNCESTFNRGLCMKVRRVSVSHFTCQVSKGTLCIGKELLITNTSYCYQVQGYLLLSCLPHAALCFDTDAANNCIVIHQ